MPKVTTELDASKTDVLGVTSTTMKRILSQPKPGDLIALYVFLAATAHRQKTQKVYCTDKFVRKGLGWSIAKVQRVKKRLRELHLIETIARRNKSGRVDGWYLLVRYLTTASRTRESLSPDAQKTTAWIFEHQNALYRSLNASDKKGGVRAADLSSEDYEADCWKIADQHDLDADFVQEFVSQHQRDGWTIKNKLTGKLEPIRHLDKALLAFCDRLESDRGHC